MIKSICLGKETLTNEMKKKLLRLKSKIKCSDTNFAPPFFSFYPFSTLNNTFQSDPQKKLVQKV